MNINEIIFTDGQINSYKQEDDQLLLNFVNYGKDKLKIIFRGNIQFEDNDGVGLEFADYSLSKKNNKHELLLLDDEKNTMFRIVFDEATYQVEND